MCFISSNIPICHYASNMHANKQQVNNENWTLKGSYDAFLKIIIWCNRIC